MDKPNRRSTKQVVKDILVSNNPDLAPKETEPEVAVKKLTAAVDKVLSLNEGIEVFRHIMRISGYQESSTILSRSTGEVNALCVAHDQGMRDLWLTLRQLIDRDKLVLIEHEPPKKRKLEPNEKEVKTHA